MATEGDSSVAAGEMAAGIVGIEHVMPGGRSVGAGMDIETVVVGDLHGEVAQEGAVLGGELVAGPFDGDARTGVHRLAALEDRVVMVAAQGGGAGGDEVAQPSDAPFGIGAIADDVAEQDEAVRAIAGHGVEAGLEGFAVGVDVGQKRDQHGCISPPTR